MSMNKVIHGAFRRDLARIKAALAAHTDGDRARAADIQRGWKFFDDELTRHHDGEHRIAWPALLAVGVSEETLASFDAEHDAMAAALADARAAMATFAGSGTRADADAAAAKVATLTEVAGEHLTNEEAVTDPIFAEHADHPALKEMGKKFQRDQGLKEAAEFFAWVQHGATAEEMAAMRKEVPGPVLALLPKLFGRRYHKEISPIWT